jgi:hypothetical protein
VLVPPIITPASGDYRKIIQVTLTHPDPGVTIHYTLDGGVQSSSIYKKPVEISEPTTHRAKAFKPGRTKSITAQKTFVVSP